MSYICYAKRKNRAWEKIHNNILKNDGYLNKQINYRENHLCDITYKDLTVKDELKLKSSGYHLLEYTISFTNDMISDAVIKRCYINLEKNKVYIDAANAADSIYDAIYKGLTKNVHVTYDPTNAEEK